MKKRSDEEGPHFFESLGQDVRYGLRVLRRNPAFTLTAVITLALGIGANTAIFTLINALLLRNLPVRDPAGLVAVGDPSQVGSISTGSLRSDLLSAPMYAQIRDQNQVFTGVFASGRSGKLIIGNMRAEQLFAFRPEESEGRRRAVELNNMLFSAALWTLPCRVTISSGD